MFALLLLADGSITDRGGDYTRPVQIHVYDHCYYHLPLTVLYKRRLHPNCPNPRVRPLLHHTTPLPLTTYSLIQTAITPDLTNLRKRPLLLPLTTYLLSYTSGDYTQTVQIHVYDHCYYHLPLPTVLYKRRLYPNCPNPRVRPLLLPLTTYSLIQAAITPDLTNLRKRPLLLPLTTYCLTQAATTVELSTSSCTTTTSTK
ncbi:hypothetical protein J6590_024144 [Homalodisca vitripennis]|nr:hypothetical protein J6590_024144 [Homalodisca vitripennis]